LLDANACSDVSIVAIGAAHLDETARLSDALQPGESNRVTWSTSPGGVAANLAQQACLHLPCSLIAAVGDDASGKSLVAQLAQTRVDFLPVKPNSSKLPSTSGRYTAVLDKNGELILGLAETQISEALSAEDILAKLKPLKTPTLVVLDANLSSTCIKALCAEPKAYMLAAVGVSPVKTMRFQEQGSTIDYLFLNRKDAAMLCASPVQTNLNLLSNKLREMGFAKHVITDGPHPLIVCDGKQTDSVDVKHKQQGKRASVNGAGDALAGAALASIVKGKNLLSAVCEDGLAAAQNHMYKSK